MLPAGHPPNHLTALQLEAMRLGSAPRADTWVASPPPASQTSGAAVIRVILLVVVVLSGLGFLRLQTASTVLPVPLPVPAINTWTRSANFTTCTQWLTEMTPSEHDAMLSGLLPVLRRTVDSAASDGSGLLPTFVADVSSTCRSTSIGDPNTYVVTAAATVAFMGDKALQP